MPVKKNKNATHHRVAKPKPRVVVIPAGTIVDVPKGTLVLRCFSGRKKVVSV